MQDDADDLPRTWPSEELVNLAFIESDVNPRATSPAMAAGIWQFVPSTARSYGMRTTAALDERRDPEKSTRAAAEHLKSLYVSLPGMAARPGRVQRRGRRRPARHRSAAHPRFLETTSPQRNYALHSKVMAMTIISRDPNRYGFSPPREEPHDTEVLHVSQPTENPGHREATGTTVKYLRELNPELVGPTTPSDRSRYALRIPRRFTWVSHQGPNGRRSPRIARRYKVSPQMLREANKLDQSDIPKAGRVILVPARRHHPGLTQIIHERFVNKLEMGLFSRCKCPELEVREHFHRPSGPPLPHLGPRREPASLAPAPPPLRGASRRGPSPDAPFDVPVPRVPKPAGPRPGGLGATRGPQFGSEFLTHHTRTGGRSPYKPGFLAAHPVLEADDRRQVPGDSQTDTAGDLPSPSG